MIFLEGINSFLLERLPELFKNLESVDDLIMQHKSAQEIQDEAEKHGMVLMWEDGFIKALKGITTVDEILRVSKE
jgi:general secretion pathway protein E